MAREFSRPIIGITSVPLVEFGAVPCAGSTVAQATAVEQAGGAPIYLPQTENEETLRAIYRQMSGLVLGAGWPDVDPQFYGEGRHHLLGPTHSATDATDLLLARWALKDDLPILAICRGMQILNVALGGALYQDIADQVGGVIDHQRGLRLDWSCTAHGIAIMAGSRLEAITRGTEAQVNSLHHQAIKHLGDGLVVAAMGPDSVIEAVESPQHMFVIATQFHPEELLAEHAWAFRIFHSFVQAAIAFSHGQSAMARG